MSPAQSQQEVERVIKQIKDLISRQAVLQELATKQEGQDKQTLVESISNRQYQGELSTLMNRLHPSDIATLLEQLPKEQCMQLWPLVVAESMGSVLLEVTDSLRDDLLEAVNPEDIIKTAAHLDSDEITDLVLELPDEMSANVLSSLPDNTREHVQSTLHFPEKTVGAWMEFDYLAVDENRQIDELIEDLRRAGAFPDDSGKLIVVNDDNEFKGILSVTDLLLQSGTQHVADIMKTDVKTFYTTTKVEKAARAFERYELMVAPVLNQHQKLVGVIRSNPIIDWMEENERLKDMAQAGLTHEENLFEPIMQSAKNRWRWIGLNLIIAFIASGIISQFEHTISSMVALAALLPVTANIGGNTGNQVVALVIRGLALEQLDRSNIRQLFVKEIKVALINGSIWGTITGIITVIMFGDFKLAFVILLAMLCTMLFAAFIGICVPLLLTKLKQDPALGSSVITTGSTDTLGFLIFLGLATLLLPI